MRFIDDKRLHTSLAHITLFKEKLDLSDAELAWHKMLVVENSYDSAPRVLRKSEEQILFLQFNYARYVCSTIQTKAQKKKLTLKEVRHIILWSQIVDKLKSNIVVANLGLIYKMLKYTGYSNSPDFDNLVTEGQMCLLRCLDTFDVSKGFKFSTYVCGSLHKSYRRYSQRLKFRQIKEISYDGALDIFEDHRAFSVKADERLENDDMFKYVRKVLKDNDADLTPVEKTVVKHRYGFSQDPKTLDEVGDIIGVTKERVRQIQIKALGKLKKAMVATVEV